MVRYILIFVFVLLLLGTCYMLGNYSSKESPGMKKALVVAKPDNSLYEYKLSKKDLIDSIVVAKRAHLLTVYQKNKELKIYRVALGGNITGAKHFEGDNKTPEGLYRIFDKNPASKYHKNLGVSYPSAADRKYASSKKKAPGGDIKIHGLPNGEGYIGKAHLLHDWTIGCIAVTDEEIDELYMHAPVGIPIMILP